MTEDRTSPPSRNDLRIGVVSQDMPTLRGEGLVPLRMEPPGTHGGLDPISFAPGLAPISETLLRDGRVVSNRPDGEQEGLAQARRRATEFGPRE